MENQKILKEFYPKWDSIGILMFNLFFPILLFINVAVAASFSQVFSNNVFNLNGNFLFNLLIFFIVTTTTILCFYCGYLCFYKKIVFYKDRLEIQYRFRKNVQIKFGDIVEANFLKSLSSKLPWCYSQLRIYKFPYGINLSFLSNTKELWEILEESINTFHSRTKEEYREICKQTDETTSKYLSWFLAPLLITPFAVGVWMVINLIIDKFF